MTDVFWTVIALGVSLAIGLGFTELVGAVWDKAERFASGRARWSDS